MILISGPCVIENKEILNETAKNIIEVINVYNEIDFYFKSSCIKDNRTNNNNFKGVGFEKGIEYLLDVKQRYGVKITTDFHTAFQVKKYAKYVDLIQIPAFLAMQSSLLDEVAKYDIPINIKKPQFLNPHNIKNPVNKIKDQNKNAIVYATDRGTKFGYDEVMFDPRHIPAMKETGVCDKTLVDITHPQNHSKMYSRNYAYTLGMASIASGADGLFMETHIDPSKALCDGDSQLTIIDFTNYINKFINLYNMIRS